jgi:hypothetical protein
VHKENVSWCVTETVHCHDIYQNFINNIDHNSQVWSQAATITITDNNMALLHISHSCVCDIIDDDCSFPPKHVVWHWRPSCGSGCNINQTAPFDFQAQQAVAWMWEVLEQQTELRFRSGPVIRPQRRYFYQ